MKTTKFNLERLKKLETSEMNKIKGGDTITIIIDGRAIIIQL